MRTDCSLRGLRGTVQEVERHLSEVLRGTREAPLITIVGSSGTLGTIESIEGHL